MIGIIPFNYKGLNYVGKTRKLSISPQDAAQVIASRIRNSADRSILNYFFALSGEWKGSPNLDQNTEGIGRLALEIGLGLEQGYFYSESSSTYINYELIGPVIEKFLGLPQHLLSQEQIDLILKTFGREIVVHSHLL